jgi:CubicO group peptidase (beta-lactamase class C family)
MKKIFLLVTVAFSLNLLHGQTNYSKEIEVQIERVENGLAGRIKMQGKDDYKIAERMAELKIKGLSIAVVQNYKIIWAKGYGWADENEKRLVTTETLFEPGSISKSFNALGILKLVQDKKLDLNTDINVYLKSWKFPYDSVSKNKKITLANLLSHSAGLTVSGFLGYNCKDEMPSLVNILDGKKPANTPPVRSTFEPGLKFQYSGGGIVISQLILTDITHLPYDQFMEKQVLKPLGMNNSFFSQPPTFNKLNLIATGYDGDGNMIDNKFHVYPEQAAAGLWTTPTDVCKYIIETQLAYQGKSGKVLNQEMTKLRLTPYLDKSAALGVFIEDHEGAKYFQHSAGNIGFKGIYYGSLADGNGVAVFVNSDNGAILWEIVNSVANVYHWKNFYNSITAVTIADTILERYTGLYVWDNTFAEIVKKENGYYFYCNRRFDKIYFSNETDFYTEESPVKRHFITEPSGKLTGYMKSVNGMDVGMSRRVINPDSLKDNEDFLSEVGWGFLQSKYYEEAIRYLKRGLKLNPASLVMQSNLAHCYLFKNDYEAALKIYKAHLNENVIEGISWKDMIKEDFIYFKNNKFDKYMMDRIFADLELEIPEEYKSK